MTWLVLLLVSLRLIGGTGPALPALPALSERPRVEGSERQRVEGPPVLCVALPQGVNAAGITKICDQAELASRDALPTPGVTARPGVASPTRIPWIVANGWRFMRHPARKYVYEVPAGKAALAAAEAYAYGADAALKIDPADIDALRSMLAFLEGLPAADLPAVADLAIVDDGSAATGEVMNLLARRNLLFHVLDAPSARFRIIIDFASPRYPRQEAADPSAFAQRIRRELTDEQRTLRVYGSEVVICRLTGDERRTRLHLINYGGRDIEGLRVRLSGAHRITEARVSGVGIVPLQDEVVTAGATEFSVPRLTTYGVINLRVSR